MTSIAEALVLGLRLHQIGNIQQAKQIYQQILQADSRCADALHLLGLLLHQIGESAAAIDHVKQALVIDGTNAVFHSSLALIYRDLGRLTEAVMSYRQMLSIRPEDAEGYYNLGVTLTHLNKFEEAIDAFQNSLNLAPNFADAYYNLGVVLEKLGDGASAMIAFEKTLILRPDYLAAYNNLGNLLHQKEQSDEALSCYQRVLQLQPDYAHAYYNKGTVLLRQEKLDEAACSFQKALDLRPNQIIWQLKIDSLCPSIMTSTEEISRWRENFTNSLARYPQGSINLDNWSTEVVPAGIFPPFNLPYHGRDDLNLKGQYARLFISTALKKDRDLCESSQIMQKDSSLNNLSAVSQCFPNRYRVGFLITKNHEGIFLSLMGGIINKFKNQEFSPAIICSATSLTRLQAGIKNKGVDFISIPEDLTAAVQKIKAYQFDLIYYWEVGSDALNYFLPFYRLAPVQCTSWGLSITSGIPHMDYFISSKLLEKDDAQDHYSEKLVTLETLPTYFYRPQVPFPLNSRDYFGLETNEHIYLCPQNLLKFHPDFDPIIGEILRRDTLGRLVLIKSKVQRQTDMLLARFKGTIPDVVEQIRWLSPLDLSRYLNLIAVSDVMLDTIHYSGGNTSHEALSIGIPIVTMPTKFLRGRLTLGRYKKMGLMDCVVATPGEYVDLAVKLAINPDFHSQIKTNILTHNQVLYEDTEAVQQLEVFFKQAIETAYASSVKST
ncbi:MAG: tetratricopeptide repeat protein [Anaerolineae bacterium]|nr:tetratricopeptide repeat protein [Anaerolineae bacterium]